MATVELKDKDAGEVKEVISEGTYERMSRWVDLLAPLAAPLRPSPRVESVRVVHGNTVALCAAARIAVCYPFIVITDAYF